jgi:hypothetical protein
MPTKKAIQAKHLTDEVFLAVVDRLRREAAMRPGWPDPVVRYSTGKYDGSPWVMIFDLWKAFPDVPEKVVMAKFRILERRGILDGCSCGCRGDIQIVRPDLWPAHEQKLAAEFAATRSSEAD